MDERLRDLLSEIREQDQFRTLITISERLTLLIGLSVGILVLLILNLAISLAPHFR